MMSEEALLSTSTLYAQGRSLTDEDGVMLLKTNAAAALESPNLVA